jgi:hypothetical protein
MCRGDDRMGKKGIWKMQEGEGVVLRMTGRRGDV